MRYLLSAAVLTLCTGVLNAATIHVPADQPTIQAGIDAASSGDTVLVAPGTYTGDGNRDIDFGGKNLVVMSVDGPETTIIDCQGSEPEPHRAFYLLSTEDTSAVVLQGLTLRNGYAGNGSAIWADMVSGLEVSDCLFDHNHGGGGALCQKWGNLTLIRCTFVNNTPVAVYMESYSPKDAQSNTSEVTQRTFDMTYLSLIDCVVAFNEQSFWHYGMSGQLETECTDIFGNDNGDWISLLTGLYGVNGNFSLDPRFCDTAAGNYYLASSSSCAPENSECGVQIGAFGIGCTDMVTDFGLEGEDLTHVISNTPTIFWIYDDPDMNPQDSFEVEVGNDSDWTVAEMWNTGTQHGQDTALVYEGDPLLDGNTYYLRLQVHNGIEWSPWWYETSFRMNSLPTVPGPLRPINDVYTDNQPWLWVQNSTDAEGDTLTYDYEVYDDPAEDFPVASAYSIPEQLDSTGWAVDIALNENEQYFWLTRSNDQHEYSDWSGYESFWVNGTPEPPTAPQGQYPPDTGGSPVFDMLTYFYWSPSSDPDPLDTVRYKLEVAMDAGFSFVNTFDSLPSASHTLTDSLAFSTRYWWRVTAFDNTGMSAMSPNTPDFWTWTLGDLNHSHDVEISDLVLLVDYMFNGGPAPYPLFVADIDGSCAVDISDLVYLVDYMFLGGPAPLVGCG